MSMSEAIQILQQHERSRQGRLRAIFMRTFLERETRRLRDLQAGAPVLTRDQAAVRIQAGWRGFQDRIMAKEMRYEEEAFINMRYESPSAPLLIERAKLIEQKRREW